MSRARLSKAEKIRRKAESTGNVLLTEAVSAWQSLDERSQRRLVAEVAESRRRELIFAYPDVVAVGHGFRTVGIAVGPRGAIRRRGTITPEPCVVFTVKRKWTKKPAGSAPAASKRMLPTHLLAFCDAPPIDGRPARTLCVIPVDVRTMQEFKGQARAYIRVDSAGVASQKGTIACAANVPDSSELFGLSAHHVLAMSKATSPPGSPAKQAKTSLMQAPPLEIGLLDTAWMGRVRKPEQGVSFDAALCRASGQDGVVRLRAACGLLRPTSFVREPADVPHVCQVVLADGRRFTADFVSEKLNFDPMIYSKSPPLRPRHTRLLEYRIRGHATTEGGDSGCAVVNTAEDELVGIHLGGNTNDTTIYVLPAYELFNRMLWPGLKAPTLAVGW